MNELLSTDLWPRIRKLAKNASNRHAAIGYVTDDTKVCFGKGDVLVTDASDEAIKSGQTSAAVLKAAFERRAKIYSVTGLHAKVYVFGKYAVVGSANLSLHSEQLIEAALLTDQPTTVSSARLLIEQLRAEAELINDSFIRRICNIVVERRVSPRQIAKAKRWKDRKSRCWLVGLRPVEERSEEKTAVALERALAEKQLTQEESWVSWIRFKGASKFRREAQAGDVVICIWSLGSETTPTCVYHHAPILLRQDDKATGETRFYVEEFSDSEQKSLTWKAFQKLFSQVGGTRKLSQWAVREIPTSMSAALHELWFDE